MGPSSFVSEGRASRFFELRTTPKSNSRTRRTFSNGGSNKFPHPRINYACNASRHLEGLRGRSYRPERPTSVSSWKWPLSDEARAVRQGDLRAGRVHRRSSFPFQGVDCHSPRATGAILLPNWRRLSSAVPVNAASPSCSSDPCRASPGPARATQIPRTL